MSTRSSERGEGRVGFLVAAIVVAAAVFVGAKVIPVRVSAYEFKDFLREQCRHAALRGDQAKVARNIMAKAKELNIPLEPKRLSIKRTASEMIISASYEQPIDLKVHTYVYKFDAKAKTPLF